MANIAAMRRNEAVYAKSARQTKRQLAFFFGGQFEDATAVILRDLMAKFVSENFNKKRDVNGRFSALNPSNRYKVWAKSAVGNNLAVPVTGGGGKRRVKHLATPSKAGRRTDYLFNTLFKRQGIGLRRTFKSSAVLTKARIKISGSLVPTFEKFFRGYPAFFFAQGNNPFFFTSNQQRIIDRRLNDLFNTISTLS